MTRGALLRLTPTRPELRSGSVSEASLSNRRRRIAKVRWRAELCGLTLIFLAIFHSSIATMARHHPIASPDDPVLLWGRGVRVA